MDFDHTVVVESSSTDKEHEEIEAAIESDFQIVQMQPVLVSERGREQVFGNDYLADT